MSTKTATPRVNGRTAKANRLSEASNAALDLTAQHEQARRDAIEAIYTAEGLASSALVGAIIATIEHGPTSAEEVKAVWPTCNNPGVYASNFNRGHKVQELLGMDNARKIVRDAEALDGGRVFVRVLDALGSVIKAAKEQGKVKEGFTGKAATMVVRGAQAAAKAATQPKAPAPVKQRGATVMDRATLATAAAESGRSWEDVATFVHMLSKNTSRLALPVGREEEAQKLLAALSAVDELAAKLFGSK